MKIKITDTRDKDFLAMCGELNSHLNSAVSGREKIYNTMESLDNIFYVALAVEKGVIAGMAALAKIDNDTAEIRTVFVKPLYRGKGIAKELCKHLETVAKKKGFKTMILDTWEQLSNAVKLYEKLGYTRYDGEIINEIDKWCVYMRKELV